MSDLQTVSGGRIRSFVERVERLEEEKATIADDIKEVLAEAKSEGFDVKILREIIKLRKQSEDERDERETLIDLYMKAMEAAAETTAS